MTDIDEEETRRADRDFLWLGCYSGNHEWLFTGGANAGCSPTCGCSVPVHECAKCGDCDYGDNPEADDVRARCAEGFPT